MRKPRTLAERAEAASKAKALFFRRLKELESWDEVWRFASRGPLSAEPGGQLYSNLAYFMRAGSAGDAAKEDENAAYEAPEAARRFQADRLLKTNRPGISAQRTRGYERPKPRAVDAVCAWCAH